MQLLRLQRSYRVFWDRGDVLLDAIAAYFGKWSSSPSSTSSPKRPCCLAFSESGELYLIDRYSSEDHQVIAISIVGTSPTMS